MNNSRKNDAIYTMPAVFGPSICEMQGIDGTPLKGTLSEVQQYVMAYRVDQEQVIRLLPEGYRSLRPVLRINCELLSNVSWLGGKNIERIELNTPVEVCGKKGWFNLVTWEDDCDSIVYGRELHGVPKAYADIDVRQQGAVTQIKARKGGFVFLELFFTHTGKEGGCPREDDNDGTFHYQYMPLAGSFPDESKTAFTPVELIDGKKEYCDCSFRWHEPSFTDMPVGFSWLKEICAIENREILGAYTVAFDRTQSYGGQILLSEGEA